MDYYLEIFHLLRRLQQKNRFIAFAVNTELTIAQAYILLDIDSKPEITGADLARLYDLDKSTVSRHLANLMRKGYLQSIKAHHDARMQSLSVTPKGDKLLNSYVKEWRKNLEEYSKLLNKSELELVGKYFKLLNDSLSARPFEIRREDHPIRLEMRRMIFAFGVFKDNFLDSDLTIGQWHALSEFYLSPLVHTAIDLNKVLGVPLGSLTALLLQLEKKGYVQREWDKEDRRSFLVKVTPQGERVLRKIDENAQAIVEHAYSKCGHTELVKFISCFEKFIAENVHGDKVLSSGYYVARLHDEASRTLARSFLVKESLRSGAYKRLPELLVAADSENFLLYSGRNSQFANLHAFVEFRKSDRDWQLWNFCEAAKTAKPVLVDFLGVAKAIL